jgi:hypothetical protein
MQLDPNAWGIKAAKGISENAVPLLDMTVRVAQLHMRRALAVSKDSGFGSKVFGVRSDGAVFPLAWRLPGTAAIDADALRDRQAFPTAQLDRHGLTGRDERWRRTLEVVRNGFRAEEVDNSAEAAAQAQPLLGRGAGR